MSQEFNQAVKNNIVPELLIIQKRYTNGFSKKNELLSCSKEKLDELLKVKIIDDEIIDFVAHEDDIIVIARVIKMCNRGINYSSMLVECARNEDMIKVLDEACDFIFRRDVYKILKGLNIQQAQEIINACKAGIQIDRIEQYMLGGLEASNMLQMRKALRSSFCADNEKLDYLYQLAKTMPADELREIRKLMEYSQWTVKQIKYLVSKKFDSKQLSCIRKSTDNISWQQIKLLVNKDFSFFKMQVIAEAFEIGIPTEKVMASSTLADKMCREMLLEYETAILAEKF